MQTTTVPTATELTTEIADEFAAISEAAIEAADAIMTGDGDGALAIVHLCQRHQAAADRARFAMIVQPEQQVWHARIAISAEMAGDTLADLSEMAGI